MMLTFKLIEIVDGFYHYEIYPEDNVADKGIFVFNPDTKEVKERREPNSPFNCISHFLNGMRDENGNLKESGMVAWY